jgi:hypothetical protein
LQDQSQIEVQPTNAEKESFEKGRCQEVASQKEEFKKGIGKRSEEKGLVQYEDEQEINLLKGSILFLLSVYFNKLAKRFL